MNKYASLTLLAALALIISQQAVLAAPQVALMTATEGMPGTGAVITNNIGGGTTVVTSDGTGTGTMVAATPAGVINGNPIFSSVQGLLGGAFNMASMPLTTISTSLGQLGIPTVATAPIMTVSNLFQQAGNTYG